MLGQCACVGLTKAVTKLSDFTNHLCNGDVRDEKLFFDVSHWNDKLDFVKDLLMPKVINTNEKMY